LSIPDRIEVSINELKIGDAITAADLQLPPGVTLISDPEAVVVQCVEARPEEEEAVAAAPGAAEPEVIGRKAEEEEAAEE
jgi:large subunit ribosomal protein L25